MSRLIDADALRNEIILHRNTIHSDMNKRDEAAFRSGIRKALQCLEEAPTIDHVKHGHWILKGRDNGDCSVCESNTDFPLMCCYGSPSTRYEPYPCCPWCGAMMDEEVDDG